MIPPGGADPLLALEDLTVTFRGEERRVVALDQVSLRVRRREAVCLVGESGCGKTLTALSILGILPSSARVEGGRVLFAGTDLLAVPGEELAKVRGKEVSMIFQEPMTSLNPVFTVGYQIQETILAHEDVSPSEAGRRSIELLRDVGIPAPEQRVSAYPHQLSGGQRQRVMIAMALACHPRLLVADEPTTALDVTVQAQILRLFRELQERHDLALLYITHDLRVVAHLAERVYVMYSGVIAEEGGVGEIFHSPEHPYTRGLMASLPTKARRGGPLPTIPGRVPDLAQRPPGCPFHPRCPLVTPRCRAEYPALCDFGGGHRARCPVVHGSWEGAGAP